MDACQFYSGENDGLMTGRRLPSAEAAAPGGATAPPGGGDGSSFWGRMCATQMRVGNVDLKC